MASAVMMERSGMGMPGMSMPTPTGMMGGPGATHGRHEHDDGAALHDELREMQWRHEDRLSLRRQSLGRHAAESLHHDGRRALQLLLHDERNDGLLLQPDHGHVQVRGHRGRRMHDLHQRRPRLQRHDSGLLRLHDSHDEVGLHLLHDDERHASLLRLLIGSIARGNRAKKSQALPVADRRGALARSPNAPDSARIARIGQASAASRSARKSSTSSMPTLKRTRPSSTPRAARIAAGMLA